MKITVLGAGGGEVTGSCYFVETQQAKVLVDCGLFQGTEGAGGLNRPPVGPSSSQIDAVVLTHAHLDHVGRLPLLAQTGFTGPIFATPATKAAPTAAGQPAQEQARDIQDWQNSGQNMGVSQGTNGAPAQSMNQANPYAH